MSNVHIDSLDTRIAAVAAGQHGVIARRQLRLLGATNSAVTHRIAAGRLVPVSRHVLRAAGASATPHQALMAAALSWGPQAVLSHESAAALAKLSGFEFGPIVLTVPRTVRRKGPGVVHYATVPPRDRSVIDGLPVTSVARTLIDLAATVPAERLEIPLDNALRRRIATIPWMEWSIEQTPRGKPGIRTITAIVRDRATHGIPESELETIVLRFLLDSGLPHPQVQHRVVDLGRFIARVDLAYPEEMIAIEIDGFKDHHIRADWDHDRARRNALTAAGWRVINVTYERFMQDPEGLVATIRRLLTGRER